MKSLKSIIPGITLTASLAVFSIFFINLLSIHYLSASVVALLLGIVFHTLFGIHPIYNKGIQLSSKQVLRLAIILMGLSLNFKQVVQVGLYSLAVMFFTLLTAFAVGYFIGKLLKINWKLSSLISVGTGICGGSAIAAVAPTIEAEDKDIAYAIAATFLFDIVMVVLFPIWGSALHMTDLGFGLWAGTAINDTSSVVAAGYAFSSEAGSYAVIVKLTRTLFIIPIVLIFSVIQSEVKKKESPDSLRKKVSIKKIFPYFILLFLLMVMMRSTGFVPDSISKQVTQISKFLMVMALGAIGLKTNFKDLIKSGYQPMVLGFLVSSAVVIVAYFIQGFLGQL